MRLKLTKNNGTKLSQAQRYLLPLIRAHFAPTAVESLSVTERTFPTRIRPDLQRAVDRVIGEAGGVLHFSGVGLRHGGFEGLSFDSLLHWDSHFAATASPPQYEAVDVGDRKPIECLKNGFWLLDVNGLRCAVLLGTASQYGRTLGIKVCLATAGDDRGRAWTGDFLHELDEAVQAAASYRGKVISLEQEDRYSGAGGAVLVHKLRPVARDQVILPRQTLDLLDRNVVGFIEKRGTLRGLGHSVKKGLLFYGPPGTGKTHTIHYLAGALPGHTTLLITAEQAGLLDDYMALARLLQPSIVVIEDVDLIARDREDMGSACGEALLNKLLNEMDGLREDAEILFLLTTNRPEALEAALASRPGRVDQAIEFPRPDADGRRKLATLYARGATVPEDVMASVVARTEGVSAAFIKELMRRALQFHLERAATSSLEIADVDAALDEMLFAGGSLNRKLLGGEVEQSDANEE